MPCLLGQGEEGFGRGLDAGPQTRGNQRADELVTFPEDGHGNAANIGVAFAMRNAMAVAANGVVVWSILAFKSQNDVAGSTGRQRELIANFHVVTGTPR